MVVVTVAEILSEAFRAKVLMMFPLRRGTHDFIVRAYKLSNLMKVHFASIFIGISSPSPPSKRKGTASAFEGM